MNNKTKGKVVNNIKSIYFGFNAFKDKIGNTDTLLDYFLKISGGISNIIGGKSGIIFTIILLIIIFCLNIFLEIGIKASFVIGIFIYIIFVAIRVLSLFHKMNRAKKLKSKGKGIVKHLKITSIERFIKGGKDSNTEIFYYVQIQNGNKILYSFPHSEGKIKGTSKENLRNIYGTFGYEYDNEETHKKEVLSKINKSINKDNKASKINKSLKKFIADSKMLIYENLKITVQNGYIPTYWEVNGNKITVGDTVDVYFDPKNPEYYWIDIDFLFKK